MKDRTGLRGKEPHLTPETLVGRRFGQDTFAPIRVAVVGFCPRPACLDKYRPRQTTEQYFIHVPPASVEICEDQGQAFLSLVHVYGGPVASALVEELAYYGIRYVLAYGLAGGLGTKEQKMGDLYLVERALACDGTTPHYTEERMIASDESLNGTILGLAREAGYPAMRPVQALTTDAIYREYDDKLEAAREAGCDIVNCDSSHLFAVSRAVGIKSTECGVISDVAAGSGEEWESTLSVMLSAEGRGELNPLAMTGRIAEFYVEVVLPVLVDG